VDGILVGAGTASHDNPELTAHGRGRNPVRIVLDPRGRTSGGLKLYKDKAAPTWVVTGGQKAYPKGVQILRESLKNGQFELSKVMKSLSKNNISQLFVEGGGETAWSFIKQGLVDELRLFIAPILVGGRAAKTPLEGEGWAKIKDALRLKSWSINQVGPDLLIHGWIS
jgi:diaminohydroxyphosphoribosylaminopyrimidine deaminase/5-amino-6-(5-phosphoribosylamino)uracil reductase